MPRKRRRGRPRTGRDPMIGVRVPARVLKKIDKLMVALSCDRSAAIRWLLEAGLDSGLALMLLQASKGKRQSDQICQVIAAGAKHRIPVPAGKRAGPPPSLNAPPRGPPAAGETAGPAARPSRGEA